MKVSREGALVLDASRGRSDQDGRAQGWPKSNREVRDAKEEYSTVDYSPHRMKGSKCCFVNKITSASTVAPLFSHLANFRDTLSILLAY
jgi:hypothetical protein